MYCAPKQLVAILKESESSTVLLTQELHEGSAQLRVDLADGQYRVPAVIGEEFPAVSTFAEADAGDMFDLSAAELKRMISQTLFAVDREKTSAVLVVSVAEFKMANASWLAPMARCWVRLALRMVP